MSGIEGTFGTPITLSLFCYNFVHIVHQLHGSLLVFTCNTLATVPYFS